MAADVTAAHRELEQAFEDARVSAFRLETLAEYDDDSEQEDLALFLAGQPMGPRSADTDPWLGRVRRTTRTRGQHWQRVRVVERPLSPYVQFELASFEANVDADEDVLVLDRTGYRDAEGLAQDFWLFDEGTPAAYVVWMHYTPGGALLGMERTSQPADLAAASARRTYALARAIPYRQFMSDTPARRVS